MSNPRRSCTFSTKVTTIFFGSISDIIVTGDVLKALANLDPQTLVLTEEALWTPYGDPDGMRARMWGFKVGRVLPFALNTGVIRVTRQHHRLMVRWRELLESEPYRAAQGRDWHSRPLHMISDQDVLTALLASEEFANVPLRFLLRGKDIVQYFGPYGYTLRERLIHLSGRRPAFIHSQGPKPWLWDEEELQKAERTKLPLRSLSRALALYARGAKIQAARSTSRRPGWQRIRSPELLCAPWVSGTRRLSAFRSRRLPTSFA